MVVLGNCDLRLGRKGLARSVIVRAVSKSYLPVHHIFDARRVHPIGLTGPAGEPGGGAGVGAGSGCAGCGVMGVCGLGGIGIFGLGGGGRSGTFGSGIVGPVGSGMSGPGGVGFGFGDMVKCS
jgi:hypothetical protein